MKLSFLTSAIENARIIFQKNHDKPHDPDIKGICYRSDHVRPGFVFVAIEGENMDGHDFIEDAVGRGAEAVVVEKPAKAVNAALVEVNSSRRAMAKMAEAFYCFPSSRLVLIGITGTNGKTTTACLLEHILKNNECATGVIGTIDCHFGDTIIPGGLTTPESVDLQARLLQMADAGTTHVIMEVSSHGVVQNRISGCRFAVGVFTNLSHDHLDFHKTMEAYRDAKRAFFTGYMDSGSIAVINCETQEGKSLASALEKPGKITVKTGLSENPAIECVSCGHPTEDVRSKEIRAKNVVFDEHGISGRIVLPAGEFDFHSPLVGRFNLENILCAIGAAFALGVAPEIVKRAIATFSRVPGRLEKVANNSMRNVFVDYSHTPDALENVLTTLRSITSGRLICIFGCGGDRDRQKRPQMGKIAATLANLVIVTSDNPRTENPEKIIDDILEGIKKAGAVEADAEHLDSGFDKTAYTVEPDRATAIDLGIRISLAKDALLIAGKGHETYQIIGRKTIEFDDRVQAKKAMAKYGME